jgi:hypothetical protein
VLSPVGNSPHPTTGRTSPATGLHRGTGPREVPHRALLSRDKALVATLPLDLLQHEMSRVFRSLPIGHGKPKRTQIQTLKQQFTLTKQNRYRREVQRVD